MQPSTQKILHINTSSNEKNSLTREISAKLVQDINSSHTIYRDLTKSKLPVINQSWLNGRMKPIQSMKDDEKAILSYSEILINEIKETNVIVIGMPIYNFSYPACLKLWMDLIAIPDKTFHYTKEKGRQGLMSNKKAYIVAAAGGTPIGSDTDFATPHLSYFLNFIGIDDITLIDVKNPKSYPNLCT